MGMDFISALEVQNVPQEKRSLAERGKLVPMGEQTRPGWSGKMPFYLFKCRNFKCGKLVMDYPHDWSGRQYLCCQECGEKIDF